LARDQAESLRRLRADFEGTRRVEKSGPRARSLAVTSGKGGVGKTCLAANLGILLARGDRRVIVVDTDLGLANLDVILDLRVSYNLSHVLRGEVEIADILLPAPGGISVVPGANGLAEMADLDEGEREQLLASFENLERFADLVIFDTGAGISRNTIAFAAAADETIVVTTTEPTAILDACATIKTIYRARPEADLKLVVNVAPSPQEGRRVGTVVQQFVKRTLDFEIEQLGYILRDEAVARSVRKRTPFLLGEPEGKAARSLGVVAHRLARDGTIEASRAPQGFLTRLFQVYRKLGHKQG